RAWLSLSGGRVLRAYLGGGGRRGTLLGRGWRPVTAATRAGGLVSRTSSAPGSRDLAGGGVEPVEQVGDRDHEDDRGKLLLVVVAGGGGPDLVGYRGRPGGPPGGGRGPAP